MKTFKLSFFLIAAIVSFTPVAKTAAQSVSVSVNFNTFQQELSPYGKWMNNPRFGQVWINNDAGFKPYYTNGHWEYTNYGWSWESDYDWGWAPFHYGRWEHDPYYGWMWIPGYEWASAWVSWSSYENYYGWAPLGYGININVPFGSIPYNNWNFIPRRNICDRDLNRYYVSHRQNYNFRNAVVINNYYNGNRGVGRYVRGPERREVERYTSNRIPERRIDYTDRNRNRDRNAGYNNGNNHNGGRNYNGVTQNNNTSDENNHSRGDVNRNDNQTASPGTENRREQNRINRSNKSLTDEQIQNNNGDGGNNPRRRTVDQYRDNTTTPQAIENKRPSRNVNPAPQTNENNNPGKRQNENSMNRSNDHPKNNPQQQQQRYERPAPQPQRPQMERPAPQQQRYERQTPQQQSEPVMEQRRMERRAENSSGTSVQPSNDNNQRGNRSGERRRNG